MIKVFIFVETLKKKIMKKGIDIRLSLPTLNGINDAINHYRYEYEAEFYNMIIDYICIEEDFDSEFVAGTGSIAKDYILKVRFK